MTFLSFSRGYEAEADYLGLQYLYAAGYDPTASIDMFEKMMSLEKRKPGTIAKVFSTHPMNDDRLKKTQAEIAEDSAAEAGIRCEYIGICRGAGTSAVHREPAQDALQRTRIRRPRCCAAPPAAAERRTLATPATTVPTIKRRDLVE